MKKILVICVCMSFFSLSIAEYRHSCTKNLFDNVITDCTTIKQIKEDNLSIENDIKPLYKELLERNNDEKIDYIKGNNIVIFVNKQDKKITSIEQVN